MNALSVHLIAARQGGHTWVGVFAGKDEDHRAKCGDLCFRNEEWDKLGPCLESLFGSAFGQTQDVTLLIDEIVDP